MSREQLQKTAHLVFWAALVFTLVMAWLPHGPAIPVKDKLQHMSAFITLTVLACAAYPDAKLFTVAERLSFLGAGIEMVQAIPIIHRDCDIFDWVADTTAILGVIIVVAFFRNRAALS